MTFIFRNRTIFWDISKQNREQTNWDGESNTKKQKNPYFIEQALLQGEISFSN